MAAQERPYQPPLPFRLANTLNIGVVGLLFHSFLYGLSRTKSIGLDRFQAILDERSDESKRTKGLITGAAVSLLHLVVHRLTCRT